jgi:PleD family two-component response regulator
METPQALYYAADKALYRAKNSGRDCYRVYAGMTHHQGSESA